MWTMIFYFTHREFLPKQGPQGNKKIDDVFMHRHGYIGRKIRQSKLQDKPAIIIIAFDRG